MFSCLLIRGHFPRILSTPRGDNKLNVTSLKIEIGLFVDHAYERSVDRYVSDFVNRILGQKLYRTGWFFLQLKRDTRKKPMKMDEII